VVKGGLSRIVLGVQTLPSHVLEQQPSHPYAPTPRRLHEGCPPFVILNGGIGTLAEQEGHHILVSAASSTEERHFPPTMSSVYIVAPHVLQ
jgi:hypothetical protein